MRDWLDETRWRFENWRYDHRGASKLIALLLLLGLLGLGGAAAVWAYNQGETVAYTGGQVVRTTAEGEVQTGEVETVTVDGEVRRVIRWRTREGTTVAETVTGATQYRTVQGEDVLIAGPTSTRTQAMTTPGQTVTLPGETVTLPAETVTVPGPVTTVTEPAVTETVTLPAETVTVTVAKPGAVTEPLG
jgi:hypothetical protein